MRSRIILIVGLCALAAGCGSSSGSSGPGSRTVVAAFYPLAFAAEQLGGPHATVRNLTPAGAEPHDLEISPRDVAAVHDADLVLLLGHGFQPQLERAAGSGSNVRLLLDVPGLGRNRNGDPHVWLDPHRYALIVASIGRALHAPVAAARLERQLAVLDGAYRTGLAHCARKEIVTSHEAFGYLAQRYGLRQVAITGLTPEAEPAPRELARAIAVVRATHATTIFFERLVSPRIAQTVARETGAGTAVLDPIEGLTEDEARLGANYLTLMRANLRTLRQALGCR